MHRFFIFNKQINPKEEIIPEKELIHQLTKVLRINKKEEFICIYKDLELTCILEDLKIKVVDYKKFEINKNKKITLIQAVPKNKKVSMILQKVTELDVDEIVLWQSKRSTSKLSEFHKKKDRLNKIIIEACEQSRRNDIPELFFINDLDEYDFSKAKTIVLYENEKQKKLNEAISECGAENINVVIGPEGGITNEEIETFIKKGATIATLGRNILRTETAAIASVSILVNIFR